MKRVLKWRGFNLLDDKVRAAYTWAAAIIGLLWETVIDKIDRPYLLAVFAGLLGLPAVLRRPPDQPVEGHPSEPSESDQ